MKAVLFALVAIVSCGGQAPGTGPTCAGPGAACATVMANVPRLEAAARAAGYVEVGATIDYTIVAGGAFETTATGSRPLCGTNRPAITGRGVRCLNALGDPDADPMLCGLDSFEWAQPHEYVHCTARWSLDAFDGDPRHENCALWGSEGAGMHGPADQHPCFGADPGLVQQLRAAVSTGP